jgi:hypothetical protein
LGCNDNGGGDAWCIGDGASVGVNSGGQAQLQKGEGVLGIAYAQGETVTPGVYTVQGDNVTTKTIVVGTEGSVTYFNDLNGNGVRDDGEPEIENPGIQVNLEKTAEVSTYGLKVGWSVVAFPTVMKGDGTSNVEKASQLIKELNAQGAQVTHVVMYDGGKFYTYSERQDANGNPVVFGDDFTILPGKGYFVKNYREAGVVLKGLVIENSVPLSLIPGWNLVGFYNASKEEYQGFALLEQMQSKSISADALSKWENSKYYNLILQDGSKYGNDYKVYRNVGYWLRMTGTENQTYTPE